MTGNSPEAEQPRSTPDADECETPAGGEEAAARQRGEAAPDEAAIDTSGTDQAPAATGAPKADPEGFALRGRPAPAIRFRQEVVIAGTAIVTLGLLASAWAAFEPASFWTASQRTSDPRNVVQLPEAVANAPQGYDAVPVLGPPLPGDLGRPILKHRRGTVAAKGPAARAVDDAAAERARGAAAGLAARQSDVLLPLGGQGESTSSPASRGMATRSAVEAYPAGVISAARSSLGQNPHRIVRAPSPWTISGGSVLSASLLTGINSDVPGMVVAQLTENAYDSMTGRTVLIPQGSRLIGTYQGDIGLGQRRVQVVWQRIVWPDGASLRMDELPASDAQGYAGLSDRVDAHPGQLARGVVLSTLLGVGTELTFGDAESELARALRESAQQSGAQAGDRLVGKALEVEPTILVRPGWPVSVVVREDLVLQPWRP